MRRNYNGTIQCNRNELCSLQQQSGEGGIQGSGSHILFRQSVDQLYGSGGNCRYRCDY